MNRTILVSIRGLLLKNLHKRKGELMSIKDWNATNEIRRRASNKGRGA